ncbi:MAG: hypothetical protein U9Q15_00750 [Patescibacteria group bacterium]|nr:hypothetical protein [Patescibacteria group bacterium]
MLSYFRIFTRHILSILVLSLALGYTTFTIGQTTLPDRWESKVSFVVGVENLQQTNDYIQNPTTAMMYPDYFADVVNGWMQTPSTIRSIMMEIGIDDDNYKRFATKKMERQTIAIKSNTDSQEQATELGAAIQTILTEKLEAYNTTNNTSVSFTGWELYSKHKPHWIEIYAFGAFLFGILLMFVIWQVIEFFQGKLIMRDEIEYKMGTFTSMKLRNNNFSNFLALLKNKSHKNLIFAGLNIDTFPILLQTGSQLEQQGFHVALTDAHMNERTLHHKLGVSSNIPSFNGFTDLTQEKFEQIHNYLFDMKRGNFKFLPTGTKKEFAPILFDFLAKKTDMSLISTDINSDLDTISKLQESSVLVLFYQLGKSQSEYLDMIRSNFHGDIILIEV